MGSDWYAAKFRLLRQFCWIGLIGLGIAIPAAIWLDGALSRSALITGCLMLVPLLLMLVVIPIWHWKERYRWQHSDLWGVLLVLETSGWFKILYWFRHILPDRKGTGRYALPMTDQKDSGGTFAS